MSPANLEQRLPESEPEKYLESFAEINKPSLESLEAGEKYLERGLAEEFLVSKFLMNWAKIKHFFKTK